MSDQEIQDSPKQQSDYDQDSIFDQDSTSTKEEADPKRKISKESYQQGDTNKRKMEEDQEKEDNRKKQVNTRTIMVKKLQPPPENMDKAENEPQQKTIVYKARQENKEQLFLNNLLTGDLTNPTKSITPKEIQLNQRDRIERANPIMNIREQHRIILNHNTGINHRQTQPGMYETLRKPIPIRMQQQQPMPQQVNQQQQKLMFPQAEPAVTENIRGNIQYIMPQLEPRLQQQASYIIGSVGEAARRITMGNSAEDNRCLSDAMGARQKTLQQIREKQAIPVITIKDEPENCSDNEAAFLLMSLKGGNNGQSTETKTAPQAQQNNKEKERQSKDEDIKRNEQQTNVVKAILINKTTEERSRLTTTTATGTRIATGSGAEYQTEITGLEGHSYLIHNRLVNSWLRADCIIINFRGVFQHTIFKRKTENVKEVLKYIEKWAPQVGDNKTNRTIFIKDRRILDEQKSWEANNIKSEDFVYTAICTNWEINTPKHDDWTTTKYKMNLPRIPPQPTATPITTELEQHKPVYFIFEMKGIAPEEQVKIKQSLKVSIQILDNLPPVMDTDNISTTSTNRIVTL